MLELKDTLKLKEILELRENGELRDLEKMRKLEVIMEAIRERLINCDTHFDNDQIEAVMKVVEYSGYSDMYEALKGASDLISVARQYFPKSIKNSDKFELENVCACVNKTLAKAEGRV